MLKRFADNDSKYQAYAYKICKCNDRKRDLVNEMYIKLYSILKKEPGKKIDDSYIYLMLRSIFLNERKLRKVETVPLFPYNFKDIARKDKVSNQVLELRYEVNDVLCDMVFFDREILLKTQEESLRDIAKKVGVHYCTVNNHKQTAIKKFKRLWETKQAS